MNYKCRQKSFTNVKVYFRLGTVPYMVHSVASEADWPPKTAKIPKIRDGHLSYLFILLCNAPCYHCKVVERELAYSNLGTQFWPQMIFNHQIA